MYWTPSACVTPEKATQPKVAGDQVEDQATQVSEFTPSYLAQACWFANRIPENKA